VSDLRVFGRSGEITIKAEKPEHPLARCTPDEEIHTHQFQALACGHCGRVYQWDTWVWRCGRCRRKTVLFGACEDCGGAPAARERYLEHQKGTHGGFLDTD
jgi:predicted RNA-binding Zn-ribbon protein involved in translation (DUF1610 family)